MKASVDTSGHPDIFRGAPAVPLVGRSRTISGCPADWEGSCQRAHGAGLQSPCMPWPFLKSCDWMLDTPGVLFWTQLRPGVPAALLESTLPGFQVGSSRQAGTDTGRLSQPSPSLAHQWLGCHTFCSFPIASMLYHSLSVRAHIRSHIPISCKP